MDNPRWEDINKGVLAENTRILKVFLKDEQKDKIKIYPFIVDKIIDKRDSHFAVYKEITCSGMAFSELGKVGYKLELNQEIFDIDQKTLRDTNPEKADKMLPTLDYWLDKVFPNEKNSEGKIIKWLTPWSYEIRMDWKHYSSPDRESTKMYDEPHITSWEVQKIEDENNRLISKTLVSGGYEPGLEKARYINCKNSNKYNITQDIAYAFEIFCQYEYECDTRGNFIKQYFDEDGLAYTGRKVVFYNRAIKSDSPINITYNKNLDSISRIVDSSEIYTKLYVPPIESSIMENGYVSIANTALNPTLDDFILNFDYLYQNNSISDYQLNCIKTYEASIHELNQNLINLSPVVEQLTIDINNLKSKISFTENEIATAKKSYEEYDDLYNSEINSTPIQKNINNPVSIIFVAEENYKRAVFRLQGIDTTSIIGYEDYSYEKQIFSSGSNLIIVDSPDLVRTDDTRNFYLIEDEYGYPKEIYASKDNTFLTDNNIVYLSLRYCPKNSYEAIRDQLSNKIKIKNNELINLNDQVKKKEETLEDKEQEQQDIITEKERLNHNLEIVLGPALREGYWTPSDSYEDQSQLISMEVSAKSNGIIFDEELFEEELLNYYYKKSEDIDNNLRTYYPFIEISKENLSKWTGKNIENLIIHLRNPYGSFEITDTTKLAAGWYYIIYNSTQKYYYNITVDGKPGDIVNLFLDDNGFPNIKINDNTYSATSFNGSATNLTTYFEGAGNYLGERLLYNNAGFFIGFYKKDGINTPVIILNNIKIPYEKYSTIYTSFIGEENIEKIWEKTDKITNLPSDPDGAIFCYPRIVINENNVNYKSDRLILSISGKDEPLEKYKDYSILLRQGKPYLTLKLTSNNNISNILSNTYLLKLPISRANEMLYLDAKSVSRDNAYPKYSYELKIANTPNETDIYELGQLVYVSDYSIGIHAASGYVSGITLRLDKAQEDKIQIKNYKTKFEDLFSTITASSEAMRNNQQSYNIAAGSFNSDGTINGSVLQNSILNNSISMNYSNTNVEIDDTNGIVLTNSQPYLNGVYGQVKLIGGGIFLSNAIDASGARIWNTGITPNGINAALINAGQLDVEKIRIFAGNNIAFQWNGEGIFAYKQDKGSVDLNTYVRYSDRGLQFIQGEHAAVDLGWNGLLISTQDGSTELTSEYGLTVYYGEKNEEGNNYALRLGKFNEDQEYGLRLYKKDNDNYVPTLITSNDGELWLKDILTVGDPAPVSWIDDKGQIQNGNCIAGISGIKEFSIDDNDEKYVKNDSVRFWAGREASMMNLAPFRVLQDGTLIADKAIITGDVYANDGWFKGEIQATSGIIGGWIINEDKISTNGIVLQAGTTENNGKAAIIIGEINNKEKDSVIISSDGKLTANGAVINGTINATGGEIGGLQIADISSALKQIVVEITSSNGNITKYGDEFVTTFTAIIKKGGLAIKEEEYADYKFQWCYSDNGKDWIFIYDGKKEEDYSGTHILEYSDQFTKNRYIKCKVIPPIEIKEENKDGTEGRDNNNLGTT